MTQINGTVYHGTLNDSIKKLSLQSFLSSPNAELTVFAPDDQAWVEAVGSFLQVEHLSNLHNVVLNNIVQGYFTYRDLRSPLEPVTFNCGLDSDELLNDLILQLGSVEVLLALSNDQVIQAQTRGAVSAASGPETDAGGFRLPVYQTLSAEALQVTSICMVRLNQGVFRARVWALG